MRTLSTVGANGLSSALRPLVGTAARMELRSVLRMHARRAAAGVDAFPQPTAEVTVNQFAADASWE